MNDELAIEVDLPCSKDELTSLKQLVTISANTEKAKLHWNPEKNPR